MAVVVFPVGMPAVVTVMRRGLILCLRLRRTGRRWLRGLNGTCLLIVHEKSERQSQREKTPVSFHSQNLPRKKSL
jgi:hypothetical protein